MSVSTESQIRDFINENFLFGDSSRSIEVSSSLIENDVVDSTGILELVAFIEDRFNLSVGDHEIVPGNFDSIARIAAYVASKSNAQEAA